MQNDLRSKVIEIARGEIGDQRKGSPEVREYWAKVCPELTAEQSWYAAKRQEWCGIFALWCLHEAGVTDVPWKIGRGFVYLLPKTESPLPGDIFVGPGPAWHHGLVEHYDPVVPWLVSIEGNTPTVRRRSRREPLKLTYYSLDPWIDV